jgi:hypothetical protein
MPNLFSTAKGIEGLLGEIVKKHDYQTDNPFANYMPNEFMADMNLPTAAMHIPSTINHFAFPDKFAEALYAQYPELERRKDRNVADMAINYGGAYDWGNRDFIDPETARQMAKHYQARDYFKGLLQDKPERVQDSIDDYNENFAGIMAGYRDQGNRKSMDDLVKEAYAYAMQKKGLLD